MSEDRAPYRVDPLADWWFYADVLGPDVLATENAENATENAHTNAADVTKNVEATGNEPSARLDGARRASGEAPGESVLSVLPPTQGVFSLTLRPATPDDATLTWAARNDAEARRQARHTTAIPLDIHERWYAAALTDPAKRLYVAEVDGAPVGTGRLDGGHRYTEVSVAILPGWRGMGHGSALVRALTTEAGHCGFSHLRAVSRTDNAGSLIAFLRAGYVPVRVWTDMDGEWVALDRGVGG